MFSLNFFGPICTKMFFSIICIFAVYFLLSPGKLLLLFPCKFLLPSLYIYFASVYLKMLAPSARKYLYSSTFKILLLSAENAPFQEDYVCFYAVIFTIRSLRLKLAAVPETPWLIITAIPLGPVTIWRIICFLLSQRATTVKHHISSHPIVL